MHFVGTRIHCPLCGAPPAAHHPIGTRSRDGSPLHTVLCMQCALAFTNPMPTLAEVSEFYRDSYRTAYKRTFRPRPRHVLRSARRAVPRLRRIEALGRTDGRLLDVGSGGGEFLYLMRRSGFDVRGIEPNTGYGEFSRDTYGLAVEVTTLEASPEASGPFDVITAHHVLEHLRDPVEALRKMTNWLAPGGLLVIEVPNLMATYHAPARRFHFAHLLHFRPETLAALGERVGLTVVDSLTVPMVEHVNIAFRRAGGTPSTVPLTDADRATRTRAAEEHQSAARHMMSAHPWRRLVENLARPAGERIALAGLTDPAQILERVYLRAGVPARS